MWVSPTDLTADKVYSINGVTINECLLYNHNVNKIDLPTKRTNKFKGVVIHNTNGAKSADDGRQYTAATLNNNVATRTHYYVTKLSAWCNLEDEYMNWSCGDGTVGTGNNGCISLEIIMDSKTNSDDLKARDNGAKIAAYILFKNNMTVNDMYTHNYFLNIRDGKKGDYYTLCTTPAATRNCPYYIVWDWENFRKQVDNYIKRLGGKSIYNTNNTTKEQKNVYQAVSKAAIRTGMSKSSTIVSRVIPGDYYLSIEVYPNWFKHIDGNYSMLNDGGELFKKVGDYSTRLTTAKVNVRTQPGTKSNIVTVLQPNSKVNVINDTPFSADGYSWYKVIINNKMGYIAGEYLK